MRENTFLTYESQNGFQVEKDCLAGSFLADTDNDTIEKITYQVWKNCPLVGEYILSERQGHELLLLGKKLFWQAVIQEKKALTILEEQVLVYTAVYLTQQFDESDEESQLWSYIFRRLGYENGAKNVPSFQVVYGRFRKIVSSVIENNNRFFSKEGQKYYNTLRIHSLTPGWSIEHLLNILYSFYDKNLEAQYIPNDSAFISLSNNISSRWNEEESAEDLQLRADSLASSFRMLFIYRPRFMAAVCDALTGKIDAILKGESSVLSNFNRWDQALRRWYENKTTEERQKMDARRLRASRERVATTKEQIRPEYRMSDGDVYLYVPRIRLQEVTERPVLRLYQNDTEIAVHAMSVFGDDLCLTTRELQIPISYNQKINWKAPLNFSIRIFCGEAEIYNSENLLFRRYLLLLMDGGEVRKYRYGINPCYLLTDQIQPVEIEDEAENTYLINHGGKLYYIAPSASMVMVGGENIEDRSGRDGLQWYFPKMYLDNVFLEKDEIKYYIFTSAPQLHVILSKEKQPQSFYLRIGQEKHSLAEYREDVKKRCVSLPSKARTFRDVALLEFSSGKKLLSLSYIVIPEFHYQFDKLYYRDSDKNGRVKLRIGGSTSVHTFDLFPGQSEICIQALDGAKCRIKLPRLEVYFASENAFDLPEFYWYGNCDIGDFVRINCPSDIDATLCLGNEKIEALRKGRIFEAGNYIKTHAAKHKSTLPLWIMLRRKGENLEHILLTQVVFQEEIISSPISIQGRSIDWNPEGCFIGPEKAEFFVHLENDTQEIWKYRTKLKRQNLERRFPCKDGTYKYQIVLIGKNTIFNKQPDRVLYENKLTVGDPNRVRFDEYEVHLRKVNLWSEKVQREVPYPIRDGYAILADLLFCDYTSAPNTALLSPTYEGILQFEKADGQRCSFNFREDSDYYELINPVRVWILDDSRLMLETAAGEPILVNTKNSATKNTVMLVNSLHDLSKQEQYSFIKDAGIFIYEAIPEKERQK